MTCVLYSRKEDKTVEIDISEFLEYIGIDIFIYKFKDIQENHGLFLNLTVDEVIETYQQYFPGYHLYASFLDMVCGMSNRDIMIISTDRPSFRALKLVRLFMFLEMEGPCEELKKHEREIIEELKEEGIIVLNREEYNKKIEILKTLILRYNILLEEKKMLELLWEKSVVNESQRKYITMYNIEWNVNKLLLMDYSDI